mmetsp:Transcript_45174/g.107503  ORF Transcript_45174/g.107503 Transcript_45174/m.107503 type:complete len:239 (-) Transcript_45174:1334-2050(-)
MLQAVGIQHCPATAESLAQDQLQARANHDLPIHQQSRLRFGQPHCLLQHPRQRKGHSTCPPPSQCVRHPETWVRTLSRHPCLRRGLVEAYSRGFFGGSHQEETPALRCPFVAESVQHGACQLGCAHDLLDVHDGDLRVRVIAGERDRDHGVNLGGHGDDLDCDCHGVQDCDCRGVQDCDHRCVQGCDCRDVQGCVRREGSCERSFSCQRPRKACVRASHRHFRPNRRLLVSVPRRACT